MVKIADVKWIKIVTDIFDDEKILLIESMPEADAIIVMWFKLLCLAGKNNNSGVFMLNERIAYTDEMLSTIFRRPLNTVRLALKTFETYGMIEIVDGAITIPNWGKHQTLDKIEERKKYMRGYMAERREKQKLLISGKVNSKANRKVNVSEAEEELELELELEEERDRDNRVNYQLIADMYNDTCVSFPRIKTLSDARKKAIKARFASGYTAEKFKQVFELAEQSDFLKGANSRNWQATFDWLIKDANMAKVLDGNYENKAKSVETPKPTYYVPTKEDFDF